MTGGVFWRETAGTVVAVAARLVLGGLFIYMGLNKALDPVGFLKLVREYDLVQTPLLLNFVAAGLPWFEVLCGLLLVLGVCVRGTALMLVAMLVPFTLVVLDRALGIHTATGQAFCSIKFDCGCGTGEILICRKLVENALLTAASIFLVILRGHRFGLRPGLFR